MKKVVFVLGVALLGCGGSTDDSTAASGGTSAAGGAAGTSAGKGGSTSAAGGSGTAGNGTAGTNAGGATTCTGATSTAGVQCAYAYSGMNTSASVNQLSTVTWACSDTLRTVTANGIPDHDTGTFPNANCPNTIAATSVSAKMTLTPVDAGTVTKIALGPVGYALNGVKLDPSTAGTCTVTGGAASCSLIGNTGAWSIEALGQTSFNFGVDGNNAHVQPTGDYHYHGMPEGVLTKLGKGAMAPTLVGFASDGFPVYARYGYTDPNDATSAVKTVKGSWQLKATADAGRPSTTTYPMGAFTQDYEYIAGSGDLDECNGRTGVTPEFPCGTYAYYVTDTYPFIHRCMKGTPMGGMMGMGGMGGGTGGMGAGGGPPTCQPGQTMCCGDGFCGGPETHANCPADCP